MNQILEQVDYLYLWYGIAFIMLSCLCFNVASERNNREFSWKCLGGFAFLPGLNRLVILFSYFVENSILVKIFCLLISTTSYVCLFEFTTCYCEEYKTRNRVAFLALVFISFVIGWLNIEYWACSVYTFVAFPTILYLVIHFDLIHINVGVNSKHINFLLYSLISYVFVEGYIVFACGYYKLSFLTTDIYENYGMSLLVIFIYSVFFFVMSAYLYIYKIMKPRPDHLFLKHIIFLLIIPTVFIVGWIDSGLRTKKAHEALKEDIKNIGFYMANVLSESGIERLNFTLEDEKNISYERISKYLKDYRNIQPEISNIYILKSEKYKLYYGPDCFDKNDNRHVLPGSLCDIFDVSIWNSIDTGVPTVAYLNYNNKMSMISYIPIPNKLNGQTVICVEMLTSKLKRMMRDMRLRVMFSILVIMTFLVCCYFMLDYRDTFNRKDMTFFSKHFEAMIVLLFGFIMTTIVSDTIYEHSVFNAKREFRTIALSKLIRIGQYFSYIDKFINTFSEHEEKLKQTEGSFTSFIEFAENAKKYLKFGDWLWLVSFNGGSVQDFERELLEKVPQYKNVFIKNDINTKLKFPIKYVYPFNKIYEYIGQDFSCYKNIEKVIEYAIKFCYESYSFAVLKKRQNYYTNMIVFKPIVDRNNKLLGLLAFDFIINKFIRLIMNNYPHDGIALNLYDIEDMNNYDACLFSSETIENKRFKGNNIDDRYEIYFPLFFLGQSLCVQTYPNSEYKLFANADIVLKVSLFSGFAFTIFFAILSMYLISQKKITEYEVENRMIRAKDEIDALKKSNLILMDIMEKSKQLALNSASANVSKSLFFANLSHELRTPLNGIAAMSEMLLDSEINDEQKKYAEIIKTSSDNLLNLINDILDLAKINSGKMTYEVIDFNLKELLLNTCDLFKLKTDLKGIYIKLDFDSNAPEMVSGDPTRLRQVVSNLVSNAVKFTSSGGVTVKCLCESASATEAKFYFEVCDTGIGIASENISDLFNAYTQAEKTTSRKYGGTGLGLAISQKIVMHFGGKIFVDSHVNKGSKFYFAINLKRQRKGSIHKNIEALKKL